MSVIIPLREMKESTNLEIQLLQKLLDNDEVGFEKAIDENIEKVDLYHVFGPETGFEDHTLAHVAIKCRKTFFLRCLLQRSFDANHRSKVLQSRPHLLLFAAAEGDEKNVLLLLDSGADVDSQNDEGFTALHVLVTNVARSDRKRGGDPAVRATHESCLKAVLDRGADANAEDASGRTPFDLAIRYRLERVVEMLLEGGADVELLSYDGKPAKEVLKETFPSRDFGESQGSYASEAKAAFHALRTGNHARFVELVRDATAANGEDRRQTLLQAACERGEAPFVETLLRRGADANRVSTSGESFSDESPPIVVAAARGGSSAVIELLLDESGTEVMASDPAGKNILHHVIESDSDSIREVAWPQLLKDPRVRARIDGGDICGDTVLHYAVAHGRTEMVLDLISIGVPLDPRNFCGRSALQDMDTDILRKYFDRCVTFGGRSFEEDYEIRFDYKFLLSKCTPSLAETHLLNEILMTRRHEELLSHPLITTFLWMKWEKKSWIFFFQFFLFLVLTLLTTALLMHEMFTVVSMKNRDFERYLESRATIAAHFWYYYGVIGYCVLLLALQIFQMIVSLKSYFRQKKNLLEVTAIVLVIVHGFLPAIVYHARDPHPRIRMQGSAAFCMLLLWTEVFLKLGHHPSVAVYTHMLATVVRSLLKFIAWFSPLFIAFSLSFYVLFLPQNLADDEVEFFDSYGKSLLKTAVMFSGELEFGDLFALFHTNVVSYVVFVAFLFLVVVLLNLFNGLAVSDTALIRAEAEKITYRDLARDLYGLETFLLKKNGSTLFAGPLSLLANAILLFEDCGKEDDMSVVFRPNGRFKVDEADIRALREKLRSEEEAMSRLKQNGDSKNSLAERATVLASRRRELEEVERKRQQTSSTRDLSDRLAMLLRHLQYAGEVIYSEPSPKNGIFVAKLRCIQEAEMLSF